MNHTWTYDEALVQLDEWPAEAKRVAEIVAEAAAKRDALIWNAHRAHVPKAEIARRMGIDRGTVIRVLGAEDESED